MTLSQELNQIIAENHLLKHPFYQDWMEGRLSKECLQRYAEQYHHHVAAFPRYLSRIHSQCLSTGARKHILDNLMDEEGVVGGVDHPELWARFCDGLGVSRGQLANSEPCASIQAVTETFMGYASKSYEEGLAALYAYESMVPEVAQSKIKGLIDNYQIDDKNTLSFFQVHEKADVYHRETCARLIDDFPAEKAEEAKQATFRATRALWNFLSEMHEERKSA